MRRTAVALLIAALAAPAAGQIAPRREYGPVARPNPFISDGRLPSPGVRREARDLRSRIERARESGSLSPREARRLEREARLIERLGRRYGRDGLSAAEQHELEVRAAAVRAATNRPAAARR